MNTEMCNVCYELAETFEFDIGEAYDLFDENFDSWDAGSECDVKKCSCGNIVSWSEISNFWKHIQYENLQGNFFVPTIFYSNIANRSGDHLIIMPELCALDIYHLPEEWWWVGAYEILMRSNDGITQEGFTNDCSEIIKNLFYNQFTSFAGNIGKYNDARDILDELNDREYWWLDFHTGNFLKEGDRVTLFDAISICKNTTTN